MIKVPPSIPQGAPHLSVSYQREYLNAPGHPQVRHSLSTPLQCPGNV